MGNKKIKSLLYTGIITLFLVVIVFINMWFIPYCINDIDVEYNAKVQYCDMLKAELGDKETDLINYERANTDTIVATGMYELKECEKITSNPQHWKHGELMKTQAIIILINIMMLFVFGIISRVLISLVDDIFY